jgi:hypothetical protein
MIQDGRFRKPLTASSIARRFLPCLSPAEKITVVQAIAVSTGKAAHKDQMEHDAFDCDACPVAVYLKTATPRALANWRPRLPHRLYVCSCRAARQLREVAHPGRFPAAIFVFHRLSY